MSSSLVVGAEVIPSENLSQLNYYEYWEARLPLLPGDSVSDLYLVDENLYVITDRTHLYAVHADLGTIRWSANLGGAGYQIYQPSHVQSLWGQSLTLVTTSTAIHWFRRDTGSLVYRMDLECTPTAAAVSDGVRVLVPAMDEKLHCFEFASIHGGAGVLEKWRVQMDGPAVSTPVLWGGAVYFASFDGRIRVGRITDKSAFWTFRIASPVKGDIFVDSTGVYFGGDDRAIYRLDPYTGIAQWRYLTPGFVREKPQVIGKKVFQYVEDSGVYALSADTGELKWHNVLAEQFVSARGDRVYFLSRFGDLLEIDVESGHVRARVHAGSVAHVARNPASGAMYLASKEGILLCTQHRGVPYLRFHQMQAKLLEGSPLKDTAEGEELSHDRDRATLGDLLRSQSEVDPLGN